MATKRICYNCANLINGRLNYITHEVEPGWYTIVGVSIDGIPAKSYHNPPSKKRVCDECGKRVRDFYELV